MKEKETTRIQSSYLEGERVPNFKTLSGMEYKEVYTPEDVTGFAGATRQLSLHPRYPQDNVSGQTLDPPSAKWIPLCQRKQRAN